MKLLHFLKAVYPFVAPYRSLMLVLLMQQLLQSGFEVGSRMSIKFVIDAAIIPQNYGLLMLILLGLAIAASLFVTLSLIGDFVWAKFGILVMNDLRQVAFNHIQYLSADFFQRRSSGDLVNCLVADAEKVETSLSNGLSTIVLELSSLVLSVISLFWFDWRLAILSTVGLLLCTIGPLPVLRRATHQGYHLRQADGQLANQIQQVTLAQSIIKLFNLETHTSQQFGHQLTQLHQVYVRARFWAYLAQRLPTLLFTLVQLLILGISAVMTYAGTMSIGTLISYQVLLLGLNTSVISLTWALPYVVDGAAGMRRIEELLAETPKIQAIPGAVQVDRFTRAIEFEQVSFRYLPDRPGITDVSCQIRKGAFVAFVGPSGAGKSTIAHCLTRLYDPDQGRILMDGVDLRSINPHALRSLIGVVSQDVMLFEGTIADNIRMGKLGATLEEVQAAAQAAEIHDFINQLPEGYATPVGNQGHQLSGGQRQRIALARALVRQPQILILDEATSALDPVTEAAFLQTLQQLVGHRTIIMITHRLKQTLSADQVIVMSQGQIVAQGQHHELMAKPSLYAELWQGCH
jgi:ATP-binding cassette, subfamily B, bacterial